MRKAKATVTKSERRGRAEKEKKPKVKKEKKPRRHFRFLPEGKTGDLWLILLTVVLVTFGTVMIFSASYYKSISEAGDPYVYLKRQLMWLAAGFAAMWILAKIDYHVWGRLYKIIPVICIVLLGLLFTPLGIEVNGAVRWLGAGPITIMPGEIAKLGLIIFVAGYFDRYPKRAYDFWKGVVPVVLLAGIYAGLIMLQPNMSTAFTVVFIAGGMLIVSGVKWRHMGILAGAATVAGVGLILMDTEGYRFARFTSFLGSFRRRSQKRLAGGSVSAGYGYGRPHRPGTWKQYTEESVSS